jgi:ring-1,2-phenylacetyl-CoA epoxidase subunit PaaE
MSKFHSLKVKDVIRETADAVSVGFDVPAALLPEFKYTQGQYLTLKFIINGEDIRRSYSICSSPLDTTELRVAIKQVKNGKMSTFINQNLKPGASVDVMTPMGNFYSHVDSSPNKNYVLFAGGSGITPMMSIIKTALRAEPNSTISLFYGNNDEASIIFKKEIDALAAANVSRLKVYHVLNSAPAGHPADLTGLMTVEKNINLLKANVNPAAKNEYFICGPGPMMDNVMAALKQINAPEQQIHIEYFTAPVNPAEVKPSADTVSGATATIIIDGDEKVVELEENETILEAALRIGLDAPYACQGGSCCTCRAKLESGKVDMAVNYALSASEVKDGYILTCQSRPTTPTVVVNYDKGL